MRFLKNLYIGLRAYFKAIVFIREHKLYWFLPIPALLMLGIYKLGDLIRMHHVEMNGDNMNEIVWSMIRMMIEIMAGLTLMKFSKYLVVMVLSPLLSFLSMKCEKIMTGNTYPFDLEQFYSDIKRGLRLAFRNLLWHYLFFGIIFFIAWIGWEDPKQSPVFYLSFIIGCFYYGFSFLDYVNERLKLDMRESILFIRQHRGLAVAIGLIYSLMILVPVDLGIIFSDRLISGGLSGMGEYLLHLFLWVCAAAAPILAIVAATISMHEVVNLKTAKKKSSKG